MENGVFLKMVLKKTDFRSSWKAIKDKRVFNMIFIKFYKFTSRCWFIPVGKLFLYIFSIKKPYTEPGCDETISWDCWFSKS